MRMRGAIVGAKSGVNLGRAEEGRQENVCKIACNILWASDVRTERKGCNEWKSLAAWNKCRPVSHMDLMNFKARELPVCSRFQRVMAATKSSLFIAGSQKRGDRSIERHVLGYWIKQLEKNIHWKCLF